MRKALPSPGVPAPPKPGASYLSTPHECKLHATALKVGCLQKAVFKWTAKESTACRWVHLLVPVPIKEEEIDALTKKVQAG